MRIAVPGLVFALTMLQHVVPLHACDGAAADCSSTQSETQAVAPARADTAPSQTRQPADEGLTAGTRRKSVKTIDINRDGSIARPQDGALETFRQ